MRLRTVQLACFLVLLSALGATDSAAHARAACRDCASLHLLLAQVAAVTAQASGQIPRPAAQAARTLRPSERTQVTEAWSMRPPAAHSSSVHILSGSL